MTTDRYIPPWLREILLSPPRKGGGLHQWVFRCVKALKNYMPEDEITKLMLEVSAGSDRDLTREIDQAVQYSRGYADEPPVSFDEHRPKLPQRSDAAVASCGSVQPHRLEESSPVRTAELECAQIISMMFPGDPLLCFATAPWSCAVRLRSQWQGREHSHPFMVPSPMTAMTGTNKSGREAARCLANTGPRMYQVVEFDSGTVESQAGRIVRLAAVLEPAMVLHSGGKSLHAWFPVWHLDAGQQMKFFEAACMLGADPATWLRCQLVRVPGAFRSEGVVQKCLYLNPDAFPAKS